MIPLLHLRSALAAAPQCSRLEHLLRRNLAARQRVALGRKTMSLRRRLAGAVRADRVGVGGSGDLDRFRHDAPRLRSRQRRAHRRLGRAVPPRVHPPRRRRQPRIQASHRHAREQPHGRRRCPPDAPDYSVFLDDAQIIAETQQLDFLEFADDRGTIISSAQWPAKFGYKEPLVTSSSARRSVSKRGRNARRPRPRSVCDSHAWPPVIASCTSSAAFASTRRFLASLDLPAGMRVMLYENLDHDKFLPEHLIAAADAYRSAGFCFDHSPGTAEQQRRQWRRA